jgi:hypothetical protein
MRRDADQLIFIRDQPTFALRDVVAAHIAGPACPFRPPEVSRYARGTRNQADRSAFSWSVDDVEGLPPKSLDPSEQPSLRVSELGGAAGVLPLD